MDEQLVPFSSFEARSFSARSRSLGAKKMNLLRRGGAKKQSIGGRTMGVTGQSVGRSLSPLRDWDDRHVLCPSDNANLI